MTGIYVFTVDDQEDRNAIRTSIESKIPRDRVIPHFSDATYAELLELEKNTSGFYAWGVPPGPMNIMNWLYMASGDYVLGVVGGAYRFAAEVIGRYENPKAAASIWGVEKESGESREYIFFLSEPVRINVPLDKLTDWLPGSYKNLTRIEEPHLQQIRGDFGTVGRFFKENILQTNEKGPSLDVSGIFKTVEDTATSTGIFSPVSVTDARTKHFEAIIRRRGHPRFRQALLRAYDNKCAITGCDAIEVLEAAFIRPYRGDRTHHLSNGILLRSDLHTLFDVGQIGIETKDMTVIVAEPIMRSSYRLLAGKKIFTPARPELRPSVDALDSHRVTWGL